MKYYLWKDGIKRKTEEWHYLLWEIFDITAISHELGDEKEIETIIEIRSKRLESLISYCL